MVNADSLGARVKRWADTEPTVAALVLIGSRVRVAGDPLAPDEHSDWDFQVVTSRPGLFGSREWTRALDAGEPLAYVARGGRLGSSDKVTAVFRDGAVDLVLIPLTRARLARMLFALRLERLLPGLQRGLGDLAAVLQGGSCVLKGERPWGEFLRRIAAEVPVPRLDDATAEQLADGFVCDWLATRRMIARGELLAAQRWLHHQLAEVNYRLLHELRLRRGALSRPDARRLEALADAATVDAVQVSAVPTAESLRAATDKSAVALRELMSALAPNWSWPL